MDVLNVLNSFMWSAGNIFLAYTAVVLILFLTTYLILFDPRATTGGKLIFQFMLSLAGVVFLVYIGIFIDPARGRSWNEIAVDVEPWRPAIRFFVYGFVAYSITSLSWLLVMRKWFPQKLKKASDRLLVVPRHTTEIPVVKSPTVDPKGPSGA
jgi:hypothetical protein